MEGGLRPAARADRGRRIGRGGDRMRRGISLVAIVGVMALIAAACSNNSSSSSSGASGDSNASALSYDPSAQGEGELNLVAWPLYAEKDVTQPFEQQTGCKVNGKEGNTADEMVTP